MLRHLFGRSLAVLAAVMVVFSLSLRVTAASATLETQEYPPESVESFVGNIDVKLISSEPSKGGIYCFDVCEDGRIAIGYDNKDVISVYSHDGDFLYGYSFDCSGKFYVLWEGEEICIFFIRSDVLMKLDSEGNCIDCLKVTDSAQNSKYIRQNLGAHTKQIGDVKYCMEKDIWLSSGYARLVSKDASAEVHTIYDATFEHNAATILITLFSIAFAVCVAWSLKRKDQHKSEGDTLS